MSNLRTPAFYTNFFRAVRSCEPTTYRSIRTRPTRSRGDTQLHRIERRSQSTYQNRYGPAATDHLPPPSKPEDGKSETGPTESKTNSKEVSASKDAQSASSSKQAKKAEVVLDTKHEKVKDDAVKVSQKEPVTIDAKSRTQSQTTETSSNETQSPAQSKNSAQPRSSSDAQTQEMPQDELDKPNPNRELDMVLSIPSPNELKGKASRHPHLEPSPYEHHFDTYTLVQHLASASPEDQSASFSQEQAVTLMKAIRLMLQNNLDIAKEGLVSKSDVENESYLFRAACSELRTTLQAARFAENQRQRSNRAQLQHEFDILNQKVTQDMMNMREELKGLFNDRKMGLQDEKRSVDSKISELNYEITVLLNSEAKSEVEGLRWVLTRRAAMAIGVAAFMTLSALQYYSVETRKQAEISKKRQAAQKAQEERMKETESARYTTPSRSSGTQTEGLLEESLG